MTLLKMINKIFQWKLFIYKVLFLLWKIFKFGKSSLVSMVEFFMEKVIDKGKGSIKGQIYIWRKSLQQTSFDMILHTWKCYFDEEDFDSTMMHSKRKFEFKFKWEVTTIDEKGYEKILDIIRSK